MDNLTETYGGTFSVLSTLGSFTESSGVWTKIENSVNYQFTQSTGVLTVIPVPEPSTLALLAGGALAGLALLRRRKSA